MKQWLVVLVLALVGCSKCGKKTVADGRIEQVLPRDAVAVVVVPKLSEAGAALKLLERVKVAGFVAPLQGFATSKAFVDELVRQVGVDPRSSVELEKVGLDSARGIGVAATLSGDAYLIVPVKDEAALHFRLETLAGKMLSASRGGEQQQGSVTVKTFSTKEGQARLAYAVANGWAFIGRDDFIPKLGKAAALTETERLAKDAELAAVQSEVAGQVAWAWLPSGSVLLQRTPLLNALVTVSLSDTALEARVLGGWKGDPELLSALTAQRGPDFSSSMPADAFLTGRYLGDAKGLGSVAGALVGPILNRAFDQTGFDLKAEVLARLTPGTVFALSLADRPPMDRGVPTFDIRKTNPFSYAHLSGLAPVSSAEAIGPTLDKVALAAPKFGAKLEKLNRDGHEVVFTTWSQGEGVHFAGRGTELLFASPIQRLDALLAKPAHPVAATVPSALSVTVDLNRLAASVRALPESAWGLGGFALKPTTVRWLDATDDLKRVQLNVSAKDKQVRATVTLSLAIAP